MRALTLTRWAAITALVALLITPFLLNNITGTTTLEITGGSMEPTYHRGDLVIIDTNPTQHLTPGNVVTVQRPTGVLYTHRIHTITGDDITTQGDANPTADTPTITRDDIIGTVIAHVPSPLARVITASQSLPGRISCALVLTGLILLPAMKRDHTAAPAPSR